MANFNQKLVDEAQNAGIAGGVDRSWQAIVKLPLSPARIRFLYFQSLYDQWIKASRDDESLIKILGEHGLGSETLDYDYWVNVIRAEIPNDENYKQVRHLFDEEVNRARYAVEHGTTEGTPEGSPQPNDRWREMLWGMAMTFAEKRATQAQTPKAPGDVDINELLADETGGKKKPKPPATPIASIKPIQDAVATSAAMQRMLDEFVQRTNVSQRGIGATGKGTAPATIQYGPMRSWFYNAKQSENPQLKSDLINLELRATLLIGDYVDSIFQHEQEHQEKSIVYPSSVETHRRLAKEAEDKLKELAKQGKGIKVGKGGTKNFEEGSENEQLVRQKILHNYLFNLKQPVWNAAEDNMCDQGVSNLSIPERKNPLYEFDMAHAINTTTVLLRGPGPGMVGLNRPEPTQERKESLEYELARIQGAILLAFYLRNKLVPTSPEGIERLGLDLSVVKDVDHPEYSGEQAYAEMRKLCAGISEAQPIPNDRKRLSPAAYKTYCAEKCDERNLIIDELFRRFVNPTLEKMQEKFEEKDLDQQIEELKKQMEQKGQGQPGQQGQGGGQGEGEGQEQGEGEGSGSGIPYEQEDGEGQSQSGEIPSDPSLGNKPGQGQGQGQGTEPSDKDGSGSKSWGDATRDAEKEKPNLDGKGKPGGEGKERSKMKPRSQTPGGQGVGQGGDPLKELALGDGRSWAQLREDPKYQEAVNHVAERLLAISKKFPSIVIRREVDASLLPTQAGALGDLAGRISREDVFDMEVARQTGDLNMSHLQTFRDDIEEKIASPGALFLAIDASGSMGSGPGSRLEAAMKSAAILHDAGKIAGYDIYITVWGNDFPYMITAPDVDDETTVGQFDTVLRASMSGGYVEGLHFGTHLDGAIGNMFAQVSRRRDDGSLYKEDEEVSDLPRRKRPRGPVHALFLTDGEVGSQAEKLDKAMEGKQGITIDAALTEGQDASMREIIDRVSTHGGKKSITVDIKDIATIPQQLVSWVEQRYQRVLDQVAANGGEWTLSQEKLENEAERAGIVFCEDHKGNLGNRLHEDFCKDADEQMERLATPTNKVRSQSARLVAGRLADMPDPIKKTA